MLYAQSATSAMMHQALNANLALITGASHGIGIPLTSLAVCLHCHAFFMFLQMLSR